MPPQPENHQHNAKEGDFSPTPSVFSDLAFPATEIHVRRAISLTVEKLAAFQIAPDFQFTIEIVLAELLNNIVEHSYHAKDTGKIHLKISIVADLIEIKTIDSGVPMPGLKAPHPPEPELMVDRKNLPEGGFGWFLIRKLCEDLRYQRLGSENHITLNIRN